MAVNECNVIELVKEDKSCSSEETQDQSDVANVSSHKLKWEVRVYDTAKGDIGLAIVITPPKAMKSKIVFFSHLNSSSAEWSHIPYYIHKSVDVS